MALKMMQSLVPTQNFVAYLQSGLLERSPPGCFAGSPSQVNGSDDKLGHGGWGAGGFGSFTGQRVKGDR